MSNEKRVHARIAVPINARLVTGATETELSVRDISRGGIFLYTKAPPAQVGAAITLKLALTAGIKPLTVRGEIVRIVMDPSGAGKTVLGMGVEFSPGDAEQGRALTAMLDRAMLGRGTNNRAYPRVYYLLDVTCRTKAELKAVLRDVGEGGLGLTVDRALHKDEEVGVEISRPKANGALKLTGWVVSSEPVTESPGHFRIGVRFGKLSSETRAELKSFIATLIHR